MDVTHSYMPLLQELANGITYTNSQNIVLSLLTTISGIGAFTILFVLITNARKLDSPSTLLIYSQLLADFCLCFNIIIMASVNNYYGKWVWGVSGCLVNAVFTVSCSYTSVISLLVISLDRYYAAALGKPFTLTQIKLVILANWLISWGFVGTVGIYTNRYNDMMGLLNSLFYCSILWHSIDILPTFLLFLSALILFVTLTTIVYTYYHLIKLYISSNRAVEVEFVTSSPEDIPTGRPKRMSEREKELVRKAVVMASTFIIFWTPFFTMILVEFVTKEPVSWLFDTICCALILTHCASSPVIMYVMDHRIRRNVKSVFSRSKNPSH